MKVYVYVDGFNLYYRALRGTPYKWLNLIELSRRLLDPNDNIELVRYFTARVSARSGDPDAPRRQQIYFSALSTLVPTLTIHYGRFLPKKKWRPLVSTGKFVEIHDTEEKGTDVSLATHLLNDGWKGSYEVGLVLSQDTDLVETIRIVTEERHLKVGLVWLDGRKPNPRLHQVSSFVRHIRTADLAAAQFPNPVMRANGSPVSKPATW
jgi:hypothetical protein